MIRRGLAAALAVTASLAGAGTASAEEVGDFRNVLPAGQGQNVNAVDLAAFELGRPPASFVDQLPMYTGLVAAAPTLTADGLGRFFKPAPLGDPAGPVLRTETPRPGVTIQRDAFNVPHVHGETRADAAWGVGYVSAEDRLFLMDLLRNYGRGRSSELAGAGANASQVRDDVDQIKAADYTEAELRRMYDQAIRAAGPEGAVLAADGRAYVDGINAYIAQVRADVTRLPAEYTLLGIPLRDWRVEDSVAVGSLIGGIFGRGGGGEVKASQVLQAAYARFGARRGRAVFDDFRRELDPETPVTITKRFDFPDPGPAERVAVALPDLGSVRESRPDGLGPSAVPAAARGAARPGLALDELAFDRHASNALLVAADRSQSGHPLAVMGPQVGFYSPQILMEIDVQGGGLDARGVAFPGSSPYILIGRGRDYAWSATSAASDNVDQFVERLCEPDGSKPTLASTHYRYNGRCIAFTARDHVIHTTPNVNDHSPARTWRLRLERSVHGPIQGRATVRGAPVAYASARSTYMHEADSLVAFKRLNDGEVHDARSFQRAIGKINFTFNWFYADDRDIAYELSGRYPIRAPGTDPSLPTWGTGRYDWVDFEPRAYTSRRVPFSALPKAINPKRGYLLSWNNRQAPGWRSADDEWEYGPVHRVRLLERAVRGALSGGRKLDLPGLVRAAEDPATSDLRGVEDYPWVRRVIGPTLPADLAPALGLLDRWSAAGAHRRDADGNGFYDEGPAVALMDAWWEPLVRSMFEPALGDALLARVRAVIQFSKTPNTKLSTEGSAFGVGWYGYVQKDLRTLLKTRVRGRFSRVYCGGGSAAACRDALLQSLRTAVAGAQARYGAPLASIRVPATCGPRTAGLPTGAQLACDQIVFRSVGAVTVPPMPAQNRPTFQQVVEVTGHRPR